MIDRHFFYAHFITAAVLGAVMTTMAAAPLERTAGLLVVGGTESGCAAAVQAARMGVTNIVLVNDIEWLGGQFSAEALGAIDENRESGYDGTVPIPRSGLFREAIDRIETLNSNKYAGIARPGNTLVITTSRPSDSEQVFRELLAPYEAQGVITRYSGYYPTQALVRADGRTLEGCVFAPVAPGGTSLTVRAALTIDASDWGDAIRLSGAAYMFGPELQSDYGEPLAPVSRATAPLTDMNPVTYCLIAVEQPGESPIPRPDGYDPCDFTLGPWSWLGFADAYTSRRLVDHYAYPQIDHPDVILLNNPHIDYPLVPFPTNVVLALEALEPGASGKNIVEMTRAQRQVVFADAKQRSLHYFYHLQTVVHSNLTDKTHSFLRFALSDEFGTPDRLPPKPYVRESLRLKSAYIVRQQDTLGWASSGLTDHRAFARIMFHDAVMSWQFEYDFHPTQRAFSSAGDPAGPWYAAIVGARGFGNGGSGKAVFPLRALIPERIDGLLGAQKNLGYTSIVSSSLRLHDQSMAVGQAAGAAAAVALRRGVPVRELPWNAGLMAELWDGLLQRSDGAVPVALWPFADLPPEHDAFPAVNQLAVRGLLPEGPYDTFFRADSAPTATWLNALSNRVVTAGYPLKPAALTPPPATRGAAASAVWSALATHPSPAWPRLAPDDADLDGVADADAPLPFNTNAVYWVYSQPAAADGLPPANVWTAAGWRGFNFTTGSAPASPPFEQDAGQSYTAARGYGWLADLSANTRLRGIYPETLRDTFVFTRYQDTWQCALSNGTYDVFFCVGDAGYDQPGQNISVGGVAVLENIDTFRGAYCESNATVTVTNGLLTVTAGRPEGGANTALNWLYVIPHGTADAPERGTRPDMLPGLAFWIRADTGVTTNASGNVTAWRDLSGRGNHAAAGDANAPSFTAHEPDLNQRPALRFNGTSQRMTVANRILTNGIEGCTVIAMVRADTNDNPSIIGIRTGSGTPFVQLDQNEAGWPRFIVRNAAGSTANAQHAQPRTGLPGMIAGCLFKGSGTLWTNRLYVSSAVPAATASADFGSATDLTSGTQYVGGLSWTAWNGLIAEVMIYERALNAQELGGILDYLTGRYKIRQAAPPPTALAVMPRPSAWFRSDACVYQDRFASEPAGPLAVTRLWADATENDHDALALDTPTLITNVVNGLPAMGFTVDGQDRYYLETPITTDPRQLTVFAVFSASPGDTEQNMLFTHRDTTTPLIQASFQHATNAVLQLRGSGNVLRTLTAPGLRTEGAFNVVMYQFDAVNDRHAVAVNGGDEVVDTYDFGIQSFLADTQRIGCCRINGSDGFFLGGFLAELLIFEGIALSRTQKNALGFYLATNYALATGYVPPGTRILIQ